MPRNRETHIFFLIGLVMLLTLPSFAHAHSEAGSGGFSSGFLHPLHGLDHMAAMIAVGLWGAYLGAPAVWLLPVTFPVVMALGGSLGIMGVPLPSVETGIALSAILLGLMVAFAARPPIWLAGMIVGFFAIFHGHAHGTELPAASNAFAYAAGFVISTGLLHLCGIGFGLLSRYPWGCVAIRAGGGGIAVLGFCFLFSVL